MDQYIRALRKEELLLEYDGWFDEENAERVVSWLVAAEDRTPVVLVGAGFSRNARIKKTGEPATRQQAPLWSELLEPFAYDLGVSPSRYDAATLFELYAEAFGSAPLRDKLREAVADADLLPVRAHDALAMYPCEAIVTTNCLDTLLDSARDRGWRRVVADSDLSTLGHERDLIYLHGHRDFPDSWVMTRSQYEDFSRSKPVMVSRVRQLLAQHPWLLVGFGMADPNFHAIMRLLGVEMRGHQPLSIALMTEQPILAERQHWRRLGIEMAVPTLRDRELGDFFPWIFEKLNTRYSPTSEAASAYIQRGVTPQEKLSRFRRVYTSPIIDPDKAYQDWKKQLTNLLNDEERAAVAARVRQANEVFFATERRPLRTSQNSPGTPRVSAPPNPALNDRLFQDMAPQFPPLASSDLIQGLDILVGKGEALRGELAEHFAWGLEKALFENERFPLPLDVLALRLAKDAGLASERIDGLVRHALYSARKYADKKAGARLDDEISRLGLSLPSPDKDPDRPHLDEAKRAYRAFMDGDYNDAIARYEAAAKLAASAKLDLETWVYTKGQADAFAVKASSQEDAPHDDDRLRTLREQAQRLAESPVVERWFRRADASARQVLEQVIEIEREREKFRVTGGRGRRFGGPSEELWRACQELRVVHAPPALQRQYAAPWLGFLDVDDAALALGLARKPRQWLDEALLRTPTTLDERVKRDRKLVATVLAEPDTLTTTELVARLECLPALGSVWRIKDVSNAMQWLQKTVTRLGRGQVSTASGWISIDRAYQEAFSAIVPWSGPDDALRCARVLALSPDNDQGTAEVLYRLPWEAWKLERGEAEGFLELCIQSLPSADSTLSPPSALGVAYALFALARMIDAGLDAQVLAPHEARLNATLVWARGVDKRTAQFSEVRRAGFFFERAFARKMDKHQDDAALFETWFGPAPDANAMDNQDGDELWGTLVDALDQIGDPEPLLEQLRQEVEQCGKKCRSDYYARNPHMAHVTVRLLSKGVVLLEEGREDIASRLLRLLNVAPNCIANVAPVIERRFWGSNWDGLMSLLIATARGVGNQPSERDDPGRATRLQLAALVLFDGLDGTTLAHEEPAVWRTLEAFALASVTDGRTLIANFAAFAAVKKAMDVTGEVENAYAAAILQIAHDARVAVRNAVADASVGLEARAKSERIRSAAREARVEVERDDNAQIQVLLARARVAPPNNSIAQKRSSEGQAQEAVS